MSRPTFEDHAAHRRHVYGNREQAMTKHSSTCFDAGYDLHQGLPDLLLAEVWRTACALTPDHNEARAFVEGYQAARKQREDAQAEDTP